MTATTLQEVSIGNFTIGSYAVCALEYGDYSGLTEAEENAIECFLKTLPPCAMFSWGSDVLATDHLTGLLAECREVEIKVLEPAS